jgi:hypothetical protein
MAGGPEPGKPQHVESRGKSYMSKAEALQLVGDCIHHWVLESPRGELTPGRCKKCGKEKEFTGETSYRIGRGSSQRH